MNRILLAFLLLCAISVHAQQHEIDSLKRLINTSSEAVELVNLNRQIGFIYLDSQVQYDSAFFYAKKAYLIAKEAELNLQQAQTLFDQAMVMNEVGNGQKALDYYDQSLSFLLETSIDEPKVLQGIAISYHNMGAIYGDLNEYAKAREHYELSKEYNAKIDFPMLKAGTTLNIGETYYLEGDYEKAKGQITESKKLYNSIGFEEAEAFLYMARTYSKLGEKEQAVKEGLDGLKIAQEKGNFKQIYELNLLLSNEFDITNSYKEAAFHTRQALLYNDSIANTEVLNQVEKLELQMKIEEQESDLENLKIRNKYLTTIYVLVILGVLLLVLLVFRQLKVSRMTKNIHDIQKRLIESELDRRNNKPKTVFDATVQGDKEWVRN